MAVMLPLLALILLQCLNHASAKLRHRIAFAASLFSLVLALLLGLPKNTFPNWELAILPARVSGTTVSVLEEPNRESAPPVPRLHVDDRHDFQLPPVNPAVSEPEWLPENQGIPTPPSATPERVESRSFGTWLAILWITGVFLGLTWWLLAWAATRRKISRLPLHRPGNVIESHHLIGGKSIQSLLNTTPIRLSEANAMPCLTGMFRPVVILPANYSQWPADQQRSVLLHELAHVARRDLLIDAVGRLANILWWWNPASWLLRWKLELECEAACDETVIDALDHHEEYAQHLIAVVRQSRQRMTVPAIGMAKHHELGQRIRRILKYVPGNSRGKTLAQLLAVAVPMTMTLFASLHLVPAQEITTGIRLNNNSAIRTTETPALAIQDEDNPPIYRVRDLLQPSQEFLLNFGQPVIHKVTVFGKVADSEGRPLKNVTLQLCDQPNSRMVDLIDWKEQRGEHGHWDFVIASTTTDDSGAYRFENVMTPPFSNNRYVHDKWEIFAKLPGFATGHFRLKSPINSEPIDIVLQPELEVGGTLVNPDGKPVANATIVAGEFCSINQDGTYFPFTTAAWLWWSHTVPKAQSDSQGNFSFSGFGAEQIISLKIDHPDFLIEHVKLKTTNRELTKTFETKEDAVSNNQSTFQLNPGRQIQLNLSSTSGTPIANARVAIQSKKTYLTSHAWTDTQGQARLNQVALGAHSVFVTLPENTPLLALSKEVEVTENLKEILVECQPGRLLYGQVDSGVAGTDYSGLVAVFKSDQPITSGAYSTWKASVEQDGKFELRVPENASGEIAIARTYINDLKFDILPLAVVKTITSGRDTQFLNVLYPNFRWTPIDTQSMNEKANPLLFSVKLTPLLKGRVVDDLGSPVKAWKYEILNPDSMVYRGNSGHHAALLPKLAVDDDRFELVGLQSALPMSLLVSNHDGSLTTFESFEVSGAGSLQTVRLKPTCQVRGKVSFDGQPLSEQMVEFRPSVNAGNRQILGSVEWVKTDENGEFVFRGYPQDTRFYVHSQKSDRDRFEWQLLTPSDDEVMQIPEMKFVSLTSSVAGIVVDSDGNPIPNAQITVSESSAPGEDYALKNLRRRFSARYGSNDDPTTDASGAFEVEGLPEGVPVDVHAFVPDARSATASTLTGSKNIKLVLDLKLKTKPKWRD